MCCIVCLDWNAGKITSKEALANIGEMMDTSETEEEVEHLWDISAKILDEETPKSDGDCDFDNFVVSLDDLEIYGPGED